MEKDEDERRQQREQEAFESDSRLKREKLANGLDYYMHPKFDSANSRRQYRDVYLKYTIEQLLIAAEWKRDVLDIQDVQMFWTAEELFVACQDIWIRMTAARFHPSGFYVGTLEYLRNQFLIYRTQEWNWLPEWHFRTYDAYDAPTEDRVVPFDIQDIYRNLKELKQIDLIEELPTPSRLHWSVDKNNITPQFKQDWIATLSSDTTPKTSDDLFKKLFGPHEKDLPDKFSLALKYAPEIVPYAQYGAEGDIIWHLSKPTKPALETSKPGISYKSSGRLVHESTGYYGTQAVNDMLTPDERKLRMQGMNYHGPSPIAATYWKFWEFLMQRPTKDVPLLGYRIKLLPPEPQCQPTEVMPDFEVNFCPLDCASARELISCYLRINPVHEANMDAGYERMKALFKALDE